MRAWVFLGLAGTVFADDVGVQIRVRWWEAAVRGNLEHKEFTPDPGDQSLRDDLDLKRGSMQSIRLAIGVRDEGVVEADEGFLFGALEVSQFDAGGDGVLDEAVDFDGRLIPSGTAFDSDMDVTIGTLLGGVAGRVPLDEVFSFVGEATADLQIVDADFVLRTPTQRFGQHSTNFVFGMAARGGLMIRDRIYLAAGVRIAWEPGTKFDEGVDMGEFELLAGVRFRRVFVEAGYRYLYFDSQVETDEFGDPLEDDVFHFALRGVFFQVGVDF